jgi:hypothetical protein
MKRPAWLPQGISFHEPFTHTPDLRLGVQLGIIQGEKHPLLDVEFYHLPYRPTLAGELVIVMVAGSHQGVLRDKDRPCPGAYTLMPGGQRTFRYPSTRAACLAAVAVADAVAQMLGNEQWMCMYPSKCPGQVIISQALKHALAHIRC